MPESKLDWIAFVLVMIGGINLGLIGAFNFDLINAILGAIPAIEKIVYILVGLSALYMIYSAKK